MKRPDQHDRLAAPGEPGLGTIEILVGQQDVFADLVDERAAAEPADAVAGHGAQDFTDHRHDDDDGEVQRLALTGYLAAGEDTPVNQGQLGTHREAHGRDEAQGEDGAVAGRLEKLLHSYPASAAGTAVISGASRADGNPSRARIGGLWLSPKGDSRQPASAFRVSAPPGAQRGRVP